MKISKTFTEFLSSSKLALILIFLLILFAIAGATVPQIGGYSSDTIALWQEQHPVLTSIYKPAGLFHVFTSLPFLCLIFILFINTLSCTVLYFFKIGGLKAFKGKYAVQYTGFFLLHLSILILFTAGMVSTGTKLDGLMVLTEGQTLSESEKGYIELAKGPFRRKEHTGFQVHLSSLTVNHFKDRRRKSVKADLGFSENGHNTEKGIVTINNPYFYRGFAFTQDETGFSPKIRISSRKSEKTLVHSFIALKTFKDKGERIYRDFLPVPFFRHKVIINFFPDYTIEDGKIYKTNEDIVNPAIFVQMYDNKGNIVNKGLIDLGSENTVGDYTFEFDEIRQWCSFRVMEDKGYIIAVIGLWLSVAALILRYAHDLIYLFSNKRPQEDNHVSS